MAGILRHLRDEGIYQRGELRDRRGFLVVIGCFRQLAVSH